MSRWTLSWLLGFSAVAMVGLSLAFSFPSRETALQKKHENYKLLVDVIEEVQQKYAKELNAEQLRELVENMITGGLERLDQHSGFINAEEYKQFSKQTAGKFGGVGIRIGLDKAGQLYVESPMVGTPAYEAGVLAGDYILKVDDKATADMPMRQVVEMIQGEPGTKVKLTVLHEGDDNPVDLEITRAEIKVDSVIGDRRMKDNLKEWDFWIDPETKIGYIRIVTFGENTVADLVKVVEGLRKANMRGLVVDLRDNPGGLLRAAVETCSMFLEEGKHVVTTKGRTPQNQEVYNSKPPAQTKPGTGYPVAILINRYSASASEIVAAALQDHLRAVIIGERSFGKGSVQNILPMENNTTALKLTTASYWRPNGRNIHKFSDSKESDDWGVKPTEGYEVKLTTEERRAYYKYRRERDIVKRNGTEAPKAEGDKKSEPFRDRVLDKALEYIRGELAKQAQRQPGQAPAPVAAVEHNAPRGAGIARRPEAVARP